MKLATWATRHRPALQTRVAAVPIQLPSHGTSPYKPSPEQHVAANIYALNHRLDQLFRVVPPAPPLVPREVLQKLSRRPLFESLSCATKDADEAMSRDKSFSSTGSLKRSMQEMSMESSDVERSFATTVSPVTAQAAATATVERALGHLKAIIPDPPVPTVMAVGQASLVLPAPTPVSSMAVPVDPRGLAASASFPPHEPGEPEPKHARKSSFLPANLNVVPEELWPGADTDDLLMDLVDSDWAIGEEF